MWLVTARGFYSVVADTTDPAGERLLIRARVRSDLEALRGLLPALEIEETPDRDYRFRARASKRAFAGVVFNLVAEVDYPNFKNAVAARQGRERAHVYSGVWADLFELQRD